MGRGIGRRLTAGIQVRQSVSPCSPGQYRSPSRGSYNPWCRSFQDTTYSLSGRPIVRTKTVRRVPSVIGTNVHIAVFPPPELAGRGPTDSQAEYWARRLRGGKPSQTASGRNSHGPATACPGRMILTPTGGAPRRWPTRRWHHAATDRPHTHPDENPGRQADHDRGR